MKTWNQNQASQFIYAPIQRIATLSGSGVPNATGDIQFRVPNVDVRLRMLIAVMFIPPAGSNLATVKAAMAQAGALWLFEEEEDRSGVSGIMVPCTNLEGTNASRLGIPVDSGLLGYAREFVTAAKSIGGIFSGANPTAGSWILQVTYVPEPGAVFTPAEWQQFSSAAAQTLITPAVSI